jgi:hypothetical protein
MAFGKKIGGGRRVAQRLPIELPALIMGVQHTETAALEDLSATGAKLRASVVPSRGDDIWLKVGTMNVLAAVAWSSNGHCGITFDTPLDSIQLHLLEAEGSRARYFRLTPELSMAAEDWCNGLAR